MTSYQLFTALLLKLAKQLTLPFPTHEPTTQHNMNEHGMVLDWSKR